MKNVVMKKHLPHWVGKQCVCRKCGTSWEMEESDVPNIRRREPDVYSRDQREVAYDTIKCPSCGDDFFLG